MDNGGEGLRKAPEKSFCWRNRPSEPFRKCKEVWLMLLLFEVVVFPVYDRAAGVGLNCGTAGVAKGAGSGPRLSSDAVGEDGGAVAPLEALFLIRPFTNALEETEQ